MRKINKLGFYLAGIRSPRGGLPLARFAGKSGAHYTIELRAAVPMARDRPAGTCLGLWQLGCHALQVPGMQHIPSKKRAEMRRRHELLSEVNNSLLDRLAPANLA